MSEQKTMTIQFRMTKKCNAECSYCINPFYENERMKLDEFKKSVDYLIDSYLPSIGIKKGDHVDLEYVGGEVSLLPTEEFKQCIDYAREQMRNAGYIFTDGAQSNFIGSEKRIDALWNKFEGNMSTSIDHFSNHRKVKGSADLYRQRFKENTQKITKGKPIRSVYVIDSEAIEHLMKEADLAMKKGYPVGLYPAYEASNPVDMADTKEMGRALCEVMDAWVLKGSAPIEPLAHILRMVVDETLNQAGCGNACPFAFGCAKRSVAIDPDGDMYVCSDMAETGNHKLGNSVEGVHDVRLVKRLGLRGIRLEGECRSCEFRNMCKGGCLNHALLDEENMYGKSHFCEVWKALFKHCYKLVEKYGAQEIHDWLNGQGKTKFYC